MWPINSNMKVKSLMAAHSRLPAAAFKIRGSGPATKYLLIAAGEALPKQDVAFKAALSTSVCVCVAHRRAGAPVDSAAASITGLRGLRTPRSLNRPRCCQHRRQSLSTVNLKCCSSRSQNSLQITRDARSCGSLHFIGKKSKTNKNIICRDNAENMLS